MCLPLRAAGFAPLLALAATLAGCASSVALDPAGYGVPPAAGSIDSQVRANINAQLGERAPDNVVIGQPARAYHARLSLGSNQVLWQGYAVPVVMDVDTLSGRRVAGRHYAAMFSGDQLVGMVDYPGTTNAKGSMGFFWDESKQPAVVADPSAKPVAAAGAVPVPSAPKAKPNDLLIDPLRPAPAPNLEPRSAPTPKNEPRQAPQVVVTPGASRGAGAATPPAAAPAAVPALPPIPEPAPVVWAPLPAEPAAGTKVYLASDKSYVGVIAEYAPLHAFANGPARPAVRVQYLNGAENWFSAKVAQQVYVVRE